jgi:hypothetical protein
MVFHKLQGNPLQQSKEKQQNPQQHLNPPAKQLFVQFSFLDGEEECPDMLLVTTYLHQDINGIN